ncbi:MAG: Gfo/Idh/MocA family oxidoreductase [Bacteroidota bacterium]|nr:Gfo/Idh/MocA family oxidoreductase [Bacteroidota bacterium]
MNSRREFLQKISGSAIGLSLLPVVQPENKGSRAENYDGQVLKVAILGLGGYATRVAEAMVNCKRAKLTGLISGTPAKIKTWQAKYNIPDKNCYNYENYDAIKNNPDIDAVYVITPNALHHEAVLRIAKAGKHAISEKPMAVSVKEGEEMIEACKKANVKLLVGYRMHFEPHTLEIIRMRNAGEFGKITFFQGLSGFIIGDPNQWRLNPKLSGGGSLMDIGIYSINGSRYMTGEDPLWVSAVETKTNTSKFVQGIDETIQFQFGFPGGAVASCLSTYSMNWLDRFFLDGTNGFAELHPATGYEPTQGLTNKGPLNLPNTVHQTVQMDEMAAIIFDGKKPVVPVDGEEALKDLRIIAAIYNSAQSGKTVKLEL